MATNQGKADRADADISPKSSSKLKQCVYRLSEIDGKLLGLSMVEARHTFRDVLETVKSVFFRVHEHPDEACKRSKYDQIRWFVAAGEFLGGLK
jgi:hypothetical protein